MTLTSFIGKYVVVVPPFFFNYLVITITSISFVWPDLFCSIMLSSVLHVIDVYRLYSPIVYVSSEGLASNLSLALPRTNPLGSYMMQTRAKSTLGHFIPHCSKFHSYFVLAHYP